MNVARNSILAVAKEDGSIITGAKDIAREFVAYYTLLCSEGPKLSSEHTLDLSKAATPLEVKEAIFQINYAGLSWISLGVERCYGKLNHTLVALVPKSDYSTYVADYQPISCFNVIYTAITKIISNRLAPALEHLIDYCQAAFVEGRNITDNIFLA
ncbi:UNVERIFIED_CONTAM: hypothetical protein Sindi_2934100 [Sesamum indicum]